RVLDIPFDVITSPSIARTGSMMRDLERPKLVAVGTNSARGKEEITEIYRKMAIVTNKIVYGTPRDVEMAYYGLSGMLAVKVAYINEMALICEKMDANIEVVSKIIGMDSRISSQILNPGPGFGGSHLPKSARLLARMAEKCGESMKTLEGTITANEKQKMKSVEKIVTILDGVKDKTIAIIGLATKPGTDDLREAPSLDVVKSLAEQGAVLRVYSPEGYQQAKWRFFSVSEALTYCDTIYDAAEGADALVIMTKWNNTRATDENLLAEKMNGRVMIDLQNLFINRHEIKRLFDYHGIGINEKYKGFKIEHES
ncbi:MAG: nucleotide sugar dehydrogenase, partial [Eubacterium sp.]